MEQLIVEFCKGMLFAMFGCMLIEAILQLCESKVRAKNFSEFGIYTILCMLGGGAFSVLIQTLGSIQEPFQIPRNNARDLMPAKN